MHCVLDHLKNSNQNFTDTSQAVYHQENKNRAWKQSCGKGILSRFDVTET